MAFMPENVKILGHLYDVQLMSQEQANDMNCIGDMDRNRLRIRVADHLAISKRAETLLHEVMHACTDAAGLMDEPGKSDEDVVNPLSRVLFSVFQENPALVAYIQKPE